MNNNRLLIAFAVVVVGIVAGAIWFLQRQQPLPNITPDPRAVAAVTPATPAPEPRTPEVAIASEPAKQDQLPPEAVKPAQQMEPWEQKIDEILRNPADEAVTAQMLINIFPTLPADGQEEAAQHISNLILDEHYSKVLPLLKNTNLPEEVLDVFVTDLMNREDSVKLPALLEIAKLPTHPHHEEALTDLEIFLDEDYGNDWPKWEAAMKKYLAEQAAEDADVAPQPAR